jgi:hypothetical protein
VVILLLGACTSGFNRSFSTVIGGGEMELELNPIDGETLSGSVTLPGIDLATIESLTWTEPPCMDESFYYVSWKDRPSEWADTERSLTELKIVLCIAANTPTVTGPWDTPASLYMRLSLSSENPGPLPATLPIDGEKVLYDSVYFDELASMSQQHGISSGTATSDSSGSLAFTELELDWRQLVGDCTEEEDCTGRFAMTGAWELDLDTATGVWQ